jgi:hypothetical protein
MTKNSASERTALQRSSQMGLSSTCRELSNSVVKGNSRIMQRFSIGTKSSSL